MKLTSFLAFVSLSSLFCVNESSIIDWINLKQDERKLKAFLKVLRESQDKEAISVTLIKHKIKSIHVIDDKELDSIFENYYRFSSDQVKIHLNNIYDKLIRAFATKMKITREYGQKKFIENTRSYLSTEESSDKDELKQMLRRARKEQKVSDQAFDVQTKHEQRRPMVSEAGLWTKLRVERNFMKVKTFLSKPENQSEKRIKIIADDMEILESDQEHFKKYCWRYVKANFKHSTNMGKPAIQIMEENLKHDLRKAIVLKKRN